MGKTNAQVTNEIIDRSYFYLYLCYYKNRKLIKITQDYINFNPLTAIITFVNVFTATISFFLLFVVRF